MKTRRKHRPSIALLIFGLIFAGIGVGISIFGPGASLVEWADMQDWQLVNAIVLSADKWTVHVRAALPGVNLDRTFVVPVYQTARLHDCSSHW